MFAYDLKRTLEKLRPNLRGAAGILIMVPTPRRGPHGAL